MESPKFKPTLPKMFVQDRCSLLCEKHKRRMAYEKRATGISPEVTEQISLWKKLSRKKSWVRSSEKTKVQHFIKCIYLQTMHVLLTFSCHFLTINKHYEWQLFKLQNKKSLNIFKAVKAIWPRVYKAILILTTEFMFSTSARQYILQGCKNKYQIMSIFC